MSDENKTDSLAFAAFLGCMGFNPISVERDQSSSKYLFVFDISEVNFNSQADIFWSRRSNIDALTYSESLKVLKSRIYQNKNQNFQYGKTE